MIKQCTTAVVYYTHTKKKQCVCGVPGFSFLLSTPLHLNPVFVLILRRTTSEYYYHSVGIALVTLAVSMKLMNIFARFSTDFSVTIVAATQVLS